MVRIRLTRMGRIHRPFYRIAAFDSRSRRDGRALEYLGFYDPLETSGTVYRLDLEGIKKWMDRGTVPSETVASFLKKEGVIVKDQVDEKRKARQAARDQKRAKAAKKG